MSPFSAQLFGFTNRRRNQCRVLYWERSGFVMWQKRLEKQRFAWPRGDEVTVTLSGRELNLLLGRGTRLYLVGVCTDGRG